MRAEERDCAAFDGVGDKPKQRNVNEQNAAAIAGGTDEKEDGECKELTFDMQRDTSDASHRTIENGNFEVKAGAGDMCLSGNDFDNRITDFYMQEF